MQPVNVFFERSRPNILLASILSGLSMIILKTSLEMVIGYRRLYPGK
jgi:hypothetical protein